MNYFNLTPEQQKTVITQTAARVGLPMQAVEKDLWVTTLLQLLFTFFEPTEPTQVKSLITSTFQQIETDMVSVIITTASPAKTFLEKTFLLHELFTTHKGDKAERKSRHLYDLEKMMDKSFAIEAISNNELWETIAHHRKLFTSVLGVDYTPDIRKRIQLTPPTNIVDVWEKDYQEMQESMIYGDSLPFNKLLERIHILENRFHNIEKQNQTKCPLNYNL